jgi:ubiquitin-conjugating enzyme E2 J2
LCTVKSNQLPTAESLIKKRNATLTAATTTTTTNQEQNLTEQAQAQHPITRTVSQGKRWLFILVVFVYLILSKLIARSSSSSANA